MMHKQVISLLVLFLLLFSYACAQDYKYKAGLRAVDSSGFYAINVTPALSRYISTTFNDVRVIDKEGRQVPYIVKSGTKPSFITSYKSLKIYTNFLDDSNRTVLILENPGREKISNIGLLLKNASVSRNANISGSNDDRNWFAISENVSFGKNYNDVKDEYIEYLQLPSSTYRYFKLTINNGKNDPLNILNAGYNSTAHSVSSNQYINNGASAFRQVDSSDESTYIFLHHEQNYHFEKLLLKLQAPRFYKRDAELFIDNYSYYFHLASDTLAALEFPCSNAGQFYLKLYNGDNPPLKVLQVYSQQQKKQLVAWLEAGETYQLLLTNPKAKKPDYELQGFIDSIPESMPVVEVSAPVIKSTSETKKLFNPNLLLWPAIIVVLIVLAALTFRLTREIKKKQ